MKTRSPFASLPLKLLLFDCAVALALPVTAVSFSHTLVFGRKLVPQHVKSAPASKSTAQARVGVKPQLSNPAPQVHFVPEIINVIVGGTNTSIATDDFTSNGIPATQAALRQPFALVVDSVGNVYFSDTDTRLVRRVNVADGTITTVAGASFFGEKTGGVHPNNSGTSQSLQRPTALAVDSNDNLYIADSDAGVVYKVDTTGDLTTVAGTQGNSGYSADGTLATTAMLNQPGGLAVDASGNIYISETGNNIVRKVSMADGTLSTIAGNYAQGAGYSGFGSDATQALLNQPAGLALDPSGRLLIADAGNYVIRRVDFTTGLITTVAGNNQIGNTGDGASATSASITDAQSLSTDAAGQIYIADTHNGTVRKVAADGTISTIAGQQVQFPSYDVAYGIPATDAELYSVSGVALDASGAVYTVSSQYGLVLKLGPEAALTFGDLEVHTTATRRIVVENTGNVAFTFGASPFTVAGTGYAQDTTIPGQCVASASVQPGASCTLAVAFSPQSIGAASGTLTIADSVGTQTVSLTGNAVKPATLTTLSVSPGTAQAGTSVTLSATVASASGAGNAPTGQVAFVDGATGNTLGTAFLSAGTASVNVTPAIGVYTINAVYNGDSTYAGSLSDEHDLTVIARTATIALAASAATSSAGAAITVSAAVSSGSGTPTGSVEFRINGGGTATAVLHGGSASTTVTAPPPGRYTLQAVYLGDANYGVAFSNTLPLTTHGAVLQFNPGAAVTFAGVPSDDNHGGFSGEGGPATSAYMHTPSGVTADGAGNVYIADEQNNVIRKVDTSGKITTVAGVPYVGSIYSTRFGGDGGLATNAYLDNPSSVILDGAGNLYIADYSNNVVRKVDAVTGIINTIAGNAATPGYNGDTGTATSIRLSHPFQLAFDPAGNLYIADTGNSLIRKIDTVGQLTTIAGNYYSYHNGNPVSGSPATSVPLYNPMGVAVSPSGSIYIADTGYNIIRTIDASGNLITVAGGNYSAAAADGVPATSTSLNRPEQLAFDAAGNYYFAESGSNIIRKVDPAGLLTTPVGFLGTFSTTFYRFDPAGQPATNFQLVGPSGVTVDSSGSLFVTDTFNQTIIRVGPSGSLFFGPSDGAANPLSLTLSNAGDSALTFAATPYSFTGNYTVAAEGASACNFTAALAPGVSCTLAVRNNGGTDGTIVFVTNAAGTPTVKLHTIATAQPSATSLYVSEQSGSVGDNVLLFAQVAVTGRPAAGSISFYDGTTLLGTATIADGYAYIYNSTLTAGSHFITAKYLGGGLYGPSTSDPSELDLTNTPTLTTLSVSDSAPSYGTSVTFTANVSTSGSVAVSSGTVRFADGNTILGSAPVNSSGMATYTIASLSTGTHTITASYVANTSYAGSTSSGLTVTVSGGGGGGGVTLDYTISLSGAPVVIHRGESKTVGVFANVANAYSGTVQLSCGTLPSYATCSFSPATLIFGGPVQNTTSILTISTTPLSSSSSTTPPLRLTQSPGGMPRLESVTTRH